MQQDLQIQTLRVIKERTLTLISQPTRWQAQVLLRTIDSLKAIITLTNNSNRSHIRHNHHVTLIKLVVTNTDSSSNSISQSQLTIIWQHLTKLVVSCPLEGSHLSTQLMQTKLLLLPHQTCQLHLHLCSHSHSCQVLPPRRSHSSQRMQQTHQHLLQASRLLQCQLQPQRLCQVLMRRA